ncbi:MAG TPA: dihydrofolate reductase [Malonomonas sp.]
MRISLIVAMSSNRVIGAEGQLPWRLPADLQRFKQLTMGQTLLMGRKTFESIGRPLPGRRTIVVSRNPDFAVEGCTLVPDLPSGIAAAQSDELFICGGAEIYRQALPLVERIYLTELLREVVGDTCFPELPAGQFRIIQTEELFDAGERCRFSVLQRCG